MFQSLGVNADQVYSDLYNSWLRDTHEKSGKDSKQLFRDIIEAGFMEKQIVLRRQRLGMNVASSLATLLHRSPLVKLDLHGNNLRDGGVEILAHLMRDLPNLVYIDLGANGIGAGYGNNNNNNNNGGAEGGKSGAAGGGRGGFAPSSERQANSNAGGSMNNTNTNSSDTTGAGGSGGANTYNGIRMLSFVVAQHRRLHTLLLGSARNDVYANRLSPAAATLLLEGCLRSRTLRVLDLSGNHVCMELPSSLSPAAAARGDGESEGGRPSSAAAAKDDDDDDDEADAESREGAGALKQAVGAARRPVDLLEQLLRASTSLATLKLKDVRLTSAGATQLVEALRDNTVLEHLDISYNGLNSTVGDGVGRLLRARSAQQCEVPLKTLILSGNDIFETESTRERNDYGVAEKMARMKRIEEYHNSYPSHGGGGAYRDANSSGGVSRVRKQFPQLDRESNHGGNSARGGAAAAAAAAAVNHDGYNMNSSSMNTGNSASGGVGGGEDRTNIPPPNNNNSADDDDDDNNSRGSDLDYPGGHDDENGSGNYTRDPFAGVKPMGEGGASDSSASELRNNSNGINSYSYGGDRRAEAAPLLLVALAQDRVLQSLALDACGVTDAVLSCLCRSLQSNHGLAELSLKGNYISTDGAVDLGRALCRHPSLRSLRLASNVLQDEGVCALATLLEGNPSLEALDLRRVWLGDRGLIALGVALQQNHTLRTLLLSDNHFTVSGGESFTAFVEMNDTVVACRLGATSVPHHVRLRLERATLRNLRRMQTAEADGLRRELVRLHYQSYKLDEATAEYANTQEKHSETKRAAENFDLQFKQDQSDNNKKIREMEEQIENYTAQAEKYRAQGAKLEEDLAKARAQFTEDMEVAAARLQLEAVAREKVEAEYHEVEALYLDLKDNAAGREAAKRDDLRVLKQDKDQWAAQRKEYKEKFDALQVEVAELEARAPAAGGGGGGGTRGRSVSAASKGGKRSASTASKSSKKKKSVAK